MTKTVFSFFFFFTASLLLLLAAASPISSAGNATSGLRYDGCAPGDTIGECITATVEEEEEEEGVEAVVRRILGQGTPLSYKSLKGRAPLNCKIYGNCIGSGNKKNKKTCTYSQRCKHDTS